MTAVDFRLIDYNYAFESGTTLSASSENSQFPVTNQALFHRSKVLRFNGNFVIDSTNNKIDFKIASLGPELTATLSSGTYTRTSLAAEIKSKLETAAASTPFTVSYSNSTGKWTIAAPGSFFSLLFATGTNVANSVASTLGFTATDRTGSLTYTGNNIALHTEEWFLMDLSTTEEIDSFSMVFDPSIGVQFTDSAVLKLQANATNSWASPSVDITLGIDDETDVISHYFTTAQSYRYWRVKVVDPRNPNLSVQLGKVILGLKLDLTRIPSVGFTLGMQDRTRAIENEFGHRYFDQYPIQRNLTFNMDLMGTSDSEILYNSYQRIGAHRPVLVVMDSQDLLFDRNKVSIYGYYAQTLGFTSIVRDILGSQLSITEAF